MTAMEEIESRGLIVIVRQLYGEELLRLGEALVQGGVGLMEITFDQGDPRCADRTAGAIASLEEHFGDRLRVGAGTVLTPEQVNAAADAGAQYIISPNTSAAVVARTKELGLLSIPAAMTPTEILNAHDLGADYVKIFPAGWLGLRYLKDVRGPINHVKFIAAAGVTEENFGEFLAAGYSAAGVSGRLTDKKLIAAGDWEELRRRAASFTAIARAAKGN